MDVNIHSTFLLNLNTPTEQEKRNRTHLAEMKRENEPRLTRIRRRFRRR